MIIYVQSLEGVEVICEFWIVSLDHRDVSFWMYVIVCTSKITFFFIVHLRYFTFFSRKKKRKKGKKKELRNSGFPLSGFVIFSPQCSIRFFSRGRNITRKEGGERGFYFIFLRSTSSSISKMFLKIVAFKLWFVRHFLRGKAQIELSRPLKGNQSRFTIGRDLWYKIIFEKIRQRNVET